MTTWSLLLLAAGLSAPVPVADPDICPDKPACAAIFCPADGVARAAVLQRQDTALPSLEACLAFTRTYQVAHPDAAEDVACQIL